MTSLAVWIGIQPIVVSGIRETRRAICSVFIALISCCIVPAALASQDEQEPRQDLNFSEQLLRLAQYEQILGLPLEENTAMCIDEALGAQWRLPDDALAAPAALTKIASVIRAAHENCLAVTDYGSELRMVSGLRTALDHQRRVALANERLAQAHVCHQASSNSFKRKECLEEVSGQTLTTTQWRRWSVLVQLGLLRQ
jgi:hypothetical protein